MKTLSIILSVLIVMSSFVLIAQSNQTYKLNGTTYLSGQTYKSTGYPKVERSSTTKKEFLESRGYNKTPSGYQVDHVVPLSKGGADQPYNMQLITTEQHKAKTASERSSTSYPKFSTPTSTYKSTYSTKSYNSTPSYNYNSRRTTYTGPKGGQYYINSNGNKTYIKHK